MQKEEDKKAPDQKAGGFGRHHAGRMALTAEGVSEEVTDTQSDTTRFGVFLALNFVLAQTDGTVHEGTLAQTVSVGQTDAAGLVVVGALELFATVRQIGRAVVGDLIAQVAEVALVLDAGASNGFGLVLSVGQAGAEGTDLGITKIGRASCRERV